MVKKQKNVELLTYLMVLVAFVIIIFAGVNIYKSCEIINKQSDANFIYITQNIKYKENNYFRDAEKEAKHCKEITEITINNEELNKIAPIAHNYNKNRIPYLENYFESIISPMLLYSAKNTKGIISIYFILDPEYIRHKNVVGIWDTDINQDGYFNSADNGPVSNMYPKNKPGLEWYYVPKKLKTGVWSNPYVDNDIKIDMITYSAPVYHRHKFIGITGVDISMDAIKNFTYKLKIYETGKAYLINQNNEVIFAKGYKTLTSTGAIDKNLHNFLNQAFTKGDNQLDDKKIKLIKSSSYKNLYAITKLYNGFVLVLEAPVSEVYSETINLITLALVLLSLTIFLIFLITIAARKKIEKINNELTENEKYTSMILDNLKDAVVIMNDDFIIESCNSVVKDIFGYLPNEIVDKRIDLLLGSESQEKDKKIWLLKKGICGKRKNGEKFPVEVDVNKIDFGDKKLLLLVISCIK